VRTAGGRRVTYDPNPGELERTVYIKWWVIWTIQILGISNIQHFWPETTVPSKLGLTLLSKKRSHDRDAYPILLERRMANIALPPQINNPHVIALPPPPQNPPNDVDFARAVDYVQRVEIAKSEIFSILF
jgi:hypothetical protein